MSEASLLEILEEFKPKIAALDPQDDGRNVLLSFYVRLGRDAAESTFLIIIRPGLGRREIAEFAAARLRRLIANALHGRQEHHMFDARFDQECALTLAYAFEERFAEITAVGFVSGVLQ